MRRFWSERTERESEAEALDKVNCPEACTEFRESKDLSEDDPDAMMDELDAPDGKRDDSDTSPESTGKDNLRRGPMVTESTADANFRYGDGGGRQIFIDDRTGLTPVRAERLSLSGDEAAALKSRTAGRAMSGWDSRPLDAEEARRLADSTDFDRAESGRRNADADGGSGMPLSREELLYLDENTADERALPRRMDSAEAQEAEDRHYQLSDQEDTGGAFFPDGAENPREMQAGESVWQLRAEHAGYESPYFTNQETIAGVRDDAGTVNLSSLMDRLQISPKEDENGTPEGDYTLTEYTFEAEDENGTDAGTQG